MKSHSGNSGKSYTFINKRTECRLKHGEFLCEVESEVDIKSVKTESQTDFDNVQVQPRNTVDGKSVPIHQESLDMIPMENTWDLNMTYMGTVLLCRVRDRVVKSAVVKAKKLVKLNILSQISLRTENGEKRIRSERKKKVRTRGGH